MENDNLLKEKHHERQELCTNRPQYRQGRKLTAVKVYAVSDESRYLLIQGVPAIAVTTELETLCLSYGSIEFLKHVPNYPAEKFCEVYQVKFHTIQSARFAKRKMDDRSFYGGTLHVCYAPELEALDDTRLKLLSRKQEIVNKLKPHHNLKCKEPSLSSPRKIKKCHSSHTVIVGEEIPSPLAGSANSPLLPESNESVVAKTSMFGLDNGIKCSKLTIEPAVPQRSVRKSSYSSIKRIVYHKSVKPKQNPLTDHSQ